MNDFILSDDSQIFKTQYLLIYAIKMHWVNAKKFWKFSTHNIISFIT